MEEKRVTVTMSLVEDMNTVVAMGTVMAQR